MQRGAGLQSGLVPTGAWVPLGEGRWECRREWNARPGRVRAPAVLDPGGQAAARHRAWAVRVAGCLLLRTAAGHEGRERAARWNG